MKKIQTVAAIALVMLLAAACERHLNADFSHEKPLIVMNGTLHADDAVTVQVSKSFSLSDTDSFAAYLPNATVNLHINGKFAEKMELERIDSSRFNERKGISYFTSRTRVRAGDLVRLETSAHGMETAWAETTVPLPPAIEKVDTAMYTVQSQDYYTNRYYEYFSDIPVEPFTRVMRLLIGVRTQSRAEHNHFGIEILKSDTLQQALYTSHYLSIHTKDDPAFANDPKNSLFDAIAEENRNYGSMRLFTNHLFKNNAYTLNLSVAGFYSVQREYETDENGNHTYVSHKVLNPPIEIAVHALSSELYQYLKSRENSRYHDQFVYISEPKVAVGNVNNGIGIVGAMATARKEIEPLPYSGGENVVPR